MPVAARPPRTHTGDVTARLVGAVAVLAGAAVWAVSTGRGPPWAVLPDVGGLVDANQLVGIDGGWGAQVVLALGGSWLGAWVALAALPRGRVGRVLVTVVYLVPPALLAADASTVGGREALVSVGLLLLLWPVPVLLVWTGAHGAAARLATGLATVGLLAQTVTVLRLLLGPGGPAPDLWLSTGGMLLVVVGAVVLGARAARRVSRARPC